MKKCIVFLADGCEECEALLIVDILRRAEIRTITAAVGGNRQIISSHQIPILADTLAEDADYSSADLIVLPGGMPGTLNLGKSPVVRQQCLSFAENKMIAAICAAPSVLADLGLLKGKRAACYPSFRDHLAAGEAAVSEAGVVTDGNIVTGQALGAAIPFALELVRLLTDEKTAASVAKAICLPE